MFEEINNKNKSKISENLGSRGIFKKRQIIMEIIGKFKHIKIKYYCLFKNLRKKEKTQATNWGKMLKCIINQHLVAIIYRELL